MGYEVGKKDRPGVRERPVGCHQELVVVKFKEFVRRVKWAVKPYDM